MEMEKEVAEEVSIFTALLTAVVVLSMACLKHFSSALLLMEQWRCWVFLVLNVVLIAVYFTSTPTHSCRHEDFKILHGGGRSRIRERKKKKKTRGGCSKVAVELHMLGDEIKNCVVKQVVGETKRVYSETTEKEKVCIFYKKTVENGSYKLEGENKNCLEKEGAEETESVYSETAEKEKVCIFFKKTVENGSHQEQEIVNIIVDDKEDDQYIDPGRLSNDELNDRVEAFITMFRHRLVLDAERGRDTEKVLPPRNEVTMRSNEIREITCSV